MSEMTPDELGKVYADAFDLCGLSDKECVDAALLAVARYVAQKQRDMEPTMGQWDDFCAVHSVPFSKFEEAYKAMQRAAPLVTGPQGGSDSPTVREDAKP